MADVSYPAFRQVVLDTSNARRLAEFYRELLGFVYRPGDEPPPPGEDDPLGRDWLALLSTDGRVRVAFQQDEDLRASTWPDGEVPQQLHLDLSVPDVEQLDAQHERAVSLGATVLIDQRDDPSEPIRVYADPDGHPFCIFVATD